MDAQSFVRRLLDLPDVTSQRQFLEQYVSLLTDEVAAALKAQADHFLRADIQRSLQMADLLYYMTELTGNQLHRALGLLVEANACMMGPGEFIHAIELYDEAAGIYKDHGREVDWAKSQVGKVGALAHLGRFVEALETGQRASGTLESHAEWQSLATLTMNLAITYGRMGEDAKALKEFDRAGEIYRQMQEQGESGWLWVQTNRAVSLRNLGQFDASVQASQTAREGLARLGQHIAAARAQQNLAVTYFVLGRYNEALDHLDQVHDVFLNDGRRRDAMLVELFISDCLLQLRRFETVLEKCRRVRSLFTELGARHVVGQAIVNEAVAYAELDRFDEALRSLDEARRIFREEGNHVWVASTDLETSAVLLFQGRCEESLILAQECARVFQDHSLPVEESQARLVAARAALVLYRYDRTFQLATEALAVGETRNVPTLTYRGHHLLGALAAAHGNHADALAEYDRAIREVERLRGRLMVEFRVGFLEDKEVIYEDAVDLCLNLNRPDQGLEYAERAKSRALLDLLAQRLDLSIEAKDEADRPIVEELAHLLAERDRLYRRWEREGEPGERGWTSSSGDRQHAQQEALALEKQIIDLRDKLLIRNADYAREAAMWHVHTEPAQPYLTPDTLLLEFYIVHRELVVFLVTANTVQVQCLPGSLAQIPDLMRKLRMNLRTVPRSALSQIADLTAKAQGLLRQFHDLLIAPLGDAPSAYPRWIIVPHGPLHYLPFHALCDGETYLLERHEISYLPSSSCLRYCREAGLADSGVIVIGNSNNGQLPHAVQEAQSIAELMGGRALLEDAATAADLRQAAPGCRTIHLAAHGDFREDNPLFSGLALADGWITTLDIFNLRLKASLVTLSACQTGRNVVGGGDELLGLMRAFLCAGAASLALSLWAVEDYSTALLMEAFYRRMVEGQTKGAALQGAQLQIAGWRNGNDPAGTQLYAHPYFWAPFFLVGDAGPL